LAVYVNISMTHGHTNIKCTEVFCSHYFC